MAFDYTTLWEAFAGGQGWQPAGSETGEAAGYAGTEISPGEDTDYYSQRMIEFYDRFVGPAFGYDWNPEEEGIQGGFGTRYPDQAGAFGGLDLNEFERAEMEFRLAIGDPYGADDPFSWESISRYGFEGEMGEAQKLLEGELFDAGQLLGGEYGSEYNTSMEQQGETYASGVLGQKEALTYGGLTAGAGIISGTSGTVLRSGETVSKAEDIMMEAYKKSKNIGAEYIEGKKTTENELRDNLTTALGIYVDTVENEKERWYNNILADIVRISAIGDVDLGDTGAYFGQYTVEGFEEWGDLCSDPTYATKADCEDAGAIWEEHALWEGLEYQPDACSDPSIDNQQHCQAAGHQWIEGYGEFREDEACETGEVYVCDDNGENCGCTPYEGLDKNVYGELIATGVGFEAIYGCTDAGACNYDAGAAPEIDDGSCQYEDCSGICGGGTAEDECGVCGGSGTIDDDHDCEGDCIRDEDCNGECAGPLVGTGADGLGNDECGVCGGDGIPDGDCNCEGGVIDECGVCGGGGIPDGYCDCDGNMEDECGECGGPGRDYECEDSSMVCGPSDCPSTDEETICEVDGDCPGECNLCQGGVCVETPECDKDCMGVWNGPAELDECGVCNGDGSSCEDCLGVINGTAERDECGVCEGDGPNEGYDCYGNCTIGEDCAGECGGTTVEDECGVCGGEGIKYPDLYDCDGVCISEYGEDCAGECNGTAVMDYCGVCNGDNTSCADCAGTPNGDAEEDSCGVCSGGESGHEADSDQDVCGVCDGPGLEDGYNCQGNCVIYSICGEDLEDCDPSFEDCPCYGQAGCPEGYRCDMGICLADPVAGGEPEEDACTNCVLISDWDVWGDACMNLLTWVKCNDGCC